MSEPKLTLFPYPQVIPAFTVLGMGGLLLYPENHLTRGRGCTWHHPGLPDCPWFYPDLDQAIEGFAITACSRQEPTVAVTREISSIYQDILSRASAEVAAIGKAYEAVPALVAWFLAARHVLRLASAPYDSLTTDKALTAKTWSNYLPESPNPELPTTPTLNAIARHWTP